MLVTGAHGSTTTSATCSFLIEFEFHGSSTGGGGGAGCDLPPPLSQGSVTTGACDFDSHGSVTVVEGPAILPLVAVGVEPFCNHPSVDEPDAADGDCVRDSQPSTFE